MNKKNGIQVLIIAIAACVVVHSFSSTHFVVDSVGRSLPAQAIRSKILPKFAGHTFSTKKTPLVKVLFSPDDNIRGHLLKLIKTEQRAIRIATFTFTDQEIMQELINAHKRGISVEIITDPSTLQDRNNRINTLVSYGIPVRIYNKNYEAKKGDSCMHHKFILFEKNNEHKPLVWTGSLNLTRAACDRNQENVTILYDENVVDSFRRQYGEVLIPRSTFYGIAYGVSDAGRNK